mmetsp:Transcript_38060/g.69574  ORF Transcript_38060/g.69574 Transcript_38060/m.69574 type:complete len:206 (-) Transcript_38060:464-1081(-)
MFFCLTASIVSAFGFVSSEKLSESSKHLLGHISKFVIVLSREARERLLGQVPKRVFLAPQHFFHPHRAPLVQLLAHVPKFVRVFPAEFRSHQLGALADFFAQIAHLVCFLAAEPRHRALHLLVQLFAQVAEFVLPFLFSGELAHHVLGHLVKHEAQVAKFVVRLVPHQRHLTAKAGRRRQGAHRRKTQKSSSAVFIKGGYFMKCT